MLDKLDTRVKLLIGVLIVLVIIVVAYHLFTRKDKKEELVIIKPDDSEIPILRMVQNSFWAEPGEAPMWFRVLTERKLRWYGLADTDIEMQYDILDPLVMVVHTAALEDYYKAPNYYKLEAVNENTIKMTMIKGLAQSAPLYLHKTSPITAFLNGTY